MGSHLIVERGDLYPVLPEREQRLVLVVRARVHREHVGAGQRRRKDPRLGVHALPEVCVTLCKVRQISDIRLENLDIHVPNYLARTRVQNWNLLE